MQYAIAAALLLFAAPASAQTKCEALKSLVLPNAQVTLAESVAAGAFTAADVTVPLPQYPKARELPAFCRVAAELKPSPDSSIHMEVWLPQENWNGKFLGVGSGGWLGAIIYSGLARGIKRGYAIAANDVGHQGNDASFAAGHPEKVIDFGYRGVHETTVKAKTIVEAFYGNAPKLAYWEGCSSGGRQGLKEAQRFPLDYDGIIAGAPANDWTHLMFSEVWTAQATQKEPATRIPDEKFDMLHAPAIKACDARDGVSDGVLEDPTQCGFDPKALQYKSGDAPDCLTAAQVQAAQKIYAGPKNPRTGQQIFPGLARGSEAGWSQLAGERPPRLPESHFRYLVFNDPAWDFKKLNFDSDVALADSLDHDIINATDPDLRKFAAHGGKLILYHGWNDQGIAPGSTVNYFNQVAGVLRERTEDAVRLFMVPGMNHCSKGDGPSVFDALAALEHWREDGEAPAEILAAKMPLRGKVERTRPLCPYPQVAKYKGSGSTDDAGNFACAVPGSSARERVRRQVRDFQSVKRAPSR